MVTRAQLRQHRQGLILYRYLVGLRNNIAMPLPLQSCAHRSLYMAQAIAISQEGHNFRLLPRLASALRHGQRLGSVRLRVQSHATLLTAALATLGETPPQLATAYASWPLPPPSRAAMTPAQ